MVQVQPFYSVDEIGKLARHRVHHNNDACPHGNAIPASKRRLGTLGYRLCGECVRLGRNGKPAIG